MIVLLQRTYHPQGVNGQITINGEFVCHTIELPWRNNRPMVSCIPEGTYVLTKRWSQRFGWHLHVTGVQQRSLILIHPANNAATELKGCIAPVSRLTGPGRGVQSRIATNRLHQLVFPVIAREITVLSVRAAQGIVSPVKTSV